MSLIDGLGSVAKVLLKANKTEEYNQIVEAQEKLITYQKNISELEDQVKKLKDISEFKEKATFENNAYWTNTEQNIKDGPFCSKCLDGDSKQIRMHIRQEDGHAICPSCKNSIWSRGEPRAYQPSDHSETNWFI